jgi:hypothetical protein
MEEAVRAGRERRLIVEPSECANQREEVGTIDVNPRFTVELRASKQLRAR